MMRTEAEIKELVRQSIANQPSREEVDRIIQAKPIENPKTFAQLLAENPHLADGLRPLVLWEKLGFPT